MSDILTVALHQGSTCSHAHHDHLVLLRLIAGTQSVGDKLLCLGGGQTVDRFIDISCADTREHHMLHIFQRDLIIIEILAEGTIQRGYRVGSLNTDRGNDDALTKTYNLRGTDTHIDSNNYTHNATLFYFRKSARCGLNVSTSMPASKQTQP